MSTVCDCPFDLDAIQDQAWIQRVEFHDTIDSTNDMAIEIAASGSHPPGPPLLVLAAEQTRGRGQRGRRWESARGSLAFSLLFTHGTPMPPRRIPPLALATATGVAEALSQRLVANSVSEARLKWPNDVTVNGKKICGVLVEPLPPAENTPAAVVIGVGVNINNQIGADLANRATSLATELGTNAPLSDCLVEILEQVDLQVEAWSTGDPRLHERWNRTCQDLGRQLSIETPGGHVEGTCREITPDGHLVLEQPDGSLQTVVSGTTTDGQSI